MDSEFDRFSAKACNIVQYDAWQNYSFSETQENIQQQQLIMYLLVKLCKERGLSVNCFQRIITRLFSIFMIDLMCRLDNKLISFSLIPQHILQRINSYTSPIDDILSDLLHSPFVNDLVLFLYFIIIYRIN